MVFREIFFNFPRPPIVCNLEPTVIRNCGSVPVEIEGCEDLRFEQSAVTDCFSGEIILSIFVNVCTQCKGINVMMKGQRLIRQLKQEELREVLGERKIC